MIAMQLNILMGLLNNNDFKKLSLNDNVYFTLRDIFANADTYDICIQANYYNSMLTNNISFEERNKNESFQYSDVLEQKEYVKKLQSWLKYFDIWWIQFEELKKLIDKQQKKLESP
jgi:hypothetical protein